MSPEHFWSGGAWLIPVLMCVAMMVVCSLISRRRGFASWGWPCGRRFYRDSTETPLEILQKRYARGDITKEDFERMQSDVQ